MFPMLPWADSLHSPYAYYFPRFFFGDGNQDTKFLWQTHSLRATASTSVPPPKCRSQTILKKSLAVRRRCRRESIIRLCFNNSNHSSKSLPRHPHIHNGPAFVIYSNQNVQPNSRAGLYSPKKFTACGANFKFYSSEGTVYSYGRISMAIETFLVTWNRFKCAIRYRKLGYVS